MVIKNPFNKEGIEAADRIREYYRMHPEEAEKISMERAHNDIKGFVWAAKKQIGGSNKSK
ncbi:MAG: hypothetical protein ACRCVG_04590 [Methanobacteriaceae archaeon]